MYLANHVTLDPSAPSIASGVPARWLWTRLRRAFPSAVAAVLLPHDVQVLVEGPSRPWARDTMRRVLAGFSRAHGTAGLWAPVGMPEEVAPGVDAALAAREVLMAPCDAGLVGDPRAWLWSTHRDVCGAVSMPWVTPGEIARATGWSLGEVLRHWHAHVTAVAPYTSVPGSDGADGLDEVLRAACVATRAAPVRLRAGGVEAQVAAGLAAHLGLGATGALARSLGVGVGACRRMARAADPDQLQAAILCLNEAVFRAAVEG